MADQRCYSRGQVDILSLLIPAHPSLLPGHSNRTRVPLLSSPVVLGWVACMTRRLNSHEGLGVDLLGKLRYLVSAGNVVEPASPAQHSRPGMRRADALRMSLPQSQRAVLQLKGRISELEAELAEQQHLRQQAADDSEFLRAELDELKKKREDTEKAQRSLTEIESERPGCVGMRVGVQSAV